MISPTLDIRPKTLSSIRFVTRFNTMLFCLLSLIKCVYSVTMNNDPKDSVGFLFTADGTETIESINYASSETEPDDDTKAPASNVEIELGSLNPRNRNVIDNDDNHDLSEKFKSMLNFEVAHDTMELDDHENVLCSADLGQDFPMFNEVNNETSTKGLAPSSSNAVPDHDVDMQASSSRLRLSSTHPHSHSLTKVFSGPKNIKDFWFSSDEDYIKKYVLKTLLEDLLEQDLEDGIDGEFVAKILNQHKTSKSLLKSMLSQSLGAISNLLPSSQSDGNTEVTGESNTQDIELSNIHLKLMEKKYLYASEVLNIKPIQDLTKIPDAEFLLRNDTYQKVKKEMKSDSPFPCNIYTYEIPLREWIQNLTLDKIVQYMVETRKDNLEVMNKKYDGFIRINNRHQLGKTLAEDNSNMDNSSNPFYELNLLLKSDDNTGIFYFFTSMLVEETDRRFHNNYLNRVRIAVPGDESTSDNNYHEGVCQHTNRLKPDPLWMSLSRVFAKKILKELTRKEEVLINRESKANQILVKGEFHHHNFKFNAKKNVILRLLRLSDAHIALDPLVWSVSAGKVYKDDAKGEIQLEHDIPYDEDNNSPSHLVSEEEIQKKNHPRSPGPSSYTDYMILMSNRIVATAKTLQTVEENEKSDQIHDLIKSAGSNPRSTSHIHEQWVRRFLSETTPQYNPYILRKLIPKFLWNDKDFIKRIMRMKRMDEKYNISDLVVENLIGADGKSGSLLNSNKNRKYSDWIADQTQFFDYRVDIIRKLNKLRKERESQGQIGQIAGHFSLKSLNPKSISTGSLKLLTGVATVAKKSLKKGFDIAKDMVTSECVEQQPLFASASSSYSATSSSDPESDYFYRETEFPELYRDLVILQYDREQMAMQKEIISKLKDEKLRNLEKEKMISESSRASFSQEACTKPYLFRFLLSDIKYAVLAPREYDDVSGNPIKSNIRFVDFHNRSRSNVSATDAVHNEVDLIPFCKLSNGASRKIAVKNWGKFITTSIRIAGFSDINKAAEFDSDSKDIELEDPRKQLTELFPGRIYYSRNDDKESGKNLLIDVNDKESRLSVKP